MPTRLLYLTATAAATVGGVVAGVLAAPLRAADPRYQRALRDFEGALQRSEDLDEAREAWRRHVADLIERPIARSTRPASAVTGAAPSPQSRDGRLTDVTSGGTIVQDAPQPATGFGGIGGPMPSTSGVGPLRVAG